MDSHLSLLPILQAMHCSEDGAILNEQVDGYVPTLVHCIEMFEQLLHCGEIEFAITDDKSSVRGFAFVPRWIFATRWSQVSVFHYPALAIAKQLLY